MLEDGELLKIPTAVVSSPLPQAQIPQYQFQQYSLCYHQQVLLGLDEETTDENRDDEGSYEM